MAARDDMAAEPRGKSAAGRERLREETRPRRGGLSPELIAILAVGVGLAGLILTMMMMIMMNTFENSLQTVREDVRILQAGQIELRERIVRVEAKLDVLAGEWPPRPAGGAAD